MKTSTNTDNTETISKQNFIILYQILKLSYSLGRDIIYLIVVIYAKILENLIEIHVNWS